MDDEQQSQPIAWVHDNDGQNMMLSEDSNLLPQNQRDSECFTDAPLPSYSGYFFPGKQTEIDRSVQEGALDELSRSEGLRLQLGAQYPYSLSLLSEKKLKPEAKMNLQELSVDYQINSFEPPRPGYNDHHQDWPSTSGPCALAMFSEHS
eukprot:TRINITY_DN12433_c0_g2_i1.p1 TRINITY_DN12433_c0_g2~~TRINITY_DN12433_c0_g2_i1.p1  ORF type:complete len:169 (-),score=29.34 TRINITY_DN12433_c0_g2_i1:107-553(-)